MHTASATSHAQTHTRTQRCTFCCVAGEYNHTYLRVGAEDIQRQGLRVAVHIGDGGIEIGHADDGQHRAEDLVLHGLVLALERAPEQRGRDVALRFVALAAHKHFAL